MKQVQKTWVLNAVKDITVAKMSSSDKGADKFSGEDVGAFMEEIYNKLAELVEKEASE